MFKSGNNCQKWQAGLKSTLGNLETDKCGFDMFMTVVAESVSNLGLRVLVSF